MLSFWVETPSSVLKMEAVCFSETLVTTQKNNIVIFTAVRNSDLTNGNMFMNWGLNTYDVSLFYDPGPLFAKRNRETQCK
jgi:hypothetical protein